MIILDSLGSQCVQCFFFFFCNIFFLFKIIHDREAYFIIENLQTEKKILPPNLPIPQVNENQTLLPTPSSSPYPSPPPT